MDRITAEEIAERSGGKVIKGDPARTAIGAETDSRKIRGDDLFVALKGTVTDGHRFLKRAADAGASVLMVSEPDAPELAMVFGDEADGPEVGDKPAVVLVDDTLKGLQELAAALRTRSAGIAILPEPDPAPAGPSRPDTNTQAGSPPAAPPCDRQGQKARSAPKTVPRRTNAPRRRRPT